jgi:hypothetical protein
MLTLDIQYDCIVSDAVLVPASSSMPGERFLSCRVVLDKRGRFNPGDRITTTPVVDTFRLRGGTLISTRNSVYVVLNSLS